MYLAPPITEGSVTEDRHLPPPPPPQRATKSTSSKVCPWSNADLGATHRGPPYPFVLKLLPNAAVKLLVDLAEVAEAGLPAAGGGRLQAAEEDLLGRGGQEGHFQVLWDGEEGGHLAGREHVLSVCVCLRILGGGNNEKEGVAGY